MSENDERVPETKTEGSLEPPARKPPTAIGARTPEPDDIPIKEIVVPIGSRVKDLAILMHVPTRRILWAAYNQFGRLVSAHRVLPFAETKALAARFGYSARRPTGEED